MIEMCKLISMRVDEMHSRLEWSMAYMVTVNLHASLKGALNDGKKYVVFETIGF